MPPLHPGPLTPPILFQFYTHIFLLYLKLSCHTLSISNNKFVCIFEISFCYLSCYSRIILFYLYKRGHLASSFLISTSPLLPLPLT
uniref:Uncharacterized protein n=1 Tax=Kalanchoe fedtschenkoi TaxID=63787 RepID=A0A7N0ZU83_KALFE